MNFFKLKVVEEFAAANRLVDLGFGSAVAASLCDAQPELLITYALRRPQGDGYRLRV